MPTRLATPSAHVWVIALENFSGCCIGSPRPAPDSPRSAVAHGMPRAHQRPGTARRVGTLPVSRFQLAPHAGSADVWLP